jgi:hypothetical protein
MKKCLKFLLIFMLLANARWVPGEIINGIQTTTTMSPINDRIEQYFWFLILDGKLDATKFLDLIALIEKNSKTKWIDKWDNYQLREKLKQDWKENCTEEWNNQTRKVVPAKNLVIKQTTTWNDSRINKTITHSLCKLASGFLMQWEKTEEGSWFPTSTVTEYLESELSYPELLALKGYLTPDQLWGYKLYKNEDEFYNRMIELGLFVG